MLLQIKQILEDMGWADGHHIPVANKENLALSAEIQKLSKAKSVAAVAFAAISEKCAALDKHLKHVLAEQQQNQRLILARQSELTAEKDLYIMAKTEKDRFTFDIKKNNTEYEKVESRRQVKLKDLNNLINKIDKLKRSIEWDEDTINEWNELLSKKEEDNDIIRKFSKEDTKKANDLEIKRLRLQEEFAHRKQLMIRTSKELNGLELVLTRNVQLYKQMHDERGLMLKQWQDAIKNLHQRDKETLSINRETFTTREIKEAKLETLAQEKQFHQNEVNNNNEIDVKIGQANFEVARLRKDSQNNQTVIKNYEVEHDSMKRELKRTADVLEQERIKTKNLYNEMVQKEKQLHQLMLKVQHLKVEIKEVQNSNMSAGDRVRTLEELIRAEEANQRSLQNELENIQNTIFRSQKTLNELVDYFKIKVLAIATMEQGLELLDKEKLQLDKDLLLVKEKDYKINFKLTILMSKMARMEGTMTDDQEEANFIRMEELEVKCKEVMDLSVMLQGQVRKLEDVMRHLTNSLTADAENLLKMKDKLQDCILLAEGAKKILKSQKDLSNQHQVDENILKVHLKHVEKLFQQEGNTIYSLQKQQIELETTMRQRESELHTNHELLNIKKMALVEDNGRMKLDIQGKKIKITNLKKRLDSLLSSIGKSETGEPVSVAYLKVKNAQEKAMLQEEGDRLDNVIRNTEKEIIAMENTLKAVNLSNDYYRKTLSLVDDNDENVIKIKELEDAIFDQTKVLRKYRQQLQEQQQKLLEIEETLKKKQEVIEELQQKLSEQEHDFELIDNEATHRKTKMERAERQIKRILQKKEVSERHKKDFITHQLQDFNKSALLQLQEASTRLLETKSSIINYLSENNLSLSTSSIHTSVKSYSSISHSTSSSAASSISIPQ